MSASSFIARKLHFKGKMAVAAIAVSFLIIIVAVAVASGFRMEIQKGLSDMAGEISLSYGPLNYLDEQDPVRLDAECAGVLDSIPGIASYRPVVCRYGIAKSEDLIQGVLVKGIPDSGLDASAVLVPRRLSTMLDIAEGDELMTYFVGERVKARRFKVRGIYDSMMDSPDNLVVIARIEDMQRLAGWDEDESSAIELILDERHHGPEDSFDVACDAGEALDMLALTLYDRYGNLFDWLNLIDGNVLAILVLMIAVAAFNMISGLLILLFRSISTIGILKSMGMTDMQVSKVFLRVSARAVALGMLIGNAAALGFCLLQDSVHLLKLNPANYFVPFVPVDVNFPALSAVNLIAFAAIMLALLVPSLFIAKVDPARTVRSK